MSKLPRFAIVQTPKGWRVRVPKSISDTGKPQRRYFKTRRLAEDFAKDSRAQFRSHGEGASVLPPRVADDAFKAWSILEPLGITLTEAARRIAKIEEDAAKSALVKDAVTAWIAAKEAKDLRERTLSSYTDTGKKLTTAFGDELLSRLTGDQLMTAIQGGSYDLHRRNLSAFWHWCAKPPRRWCRVEMMSEVENLSRESDADIAVHTPEMVRTLLQTAEQYFPELAPFYATGYFGGPRRAELRRLNGEEFSEEGIEIGKGVAKKRRRRHVPLNSTLKAWLKAYPFKIVANWRDKDSACRRLAGWDVAAGLLSKPHIRKRFGWTDETELPPIRFGRWQQNAIRHTHASGEIADGASIEDLMFRFGHIGNVETLRGHYVGRMSPAQAKEILSIGPRGTTIKPGKKKPKR